VPRACLKSDRTITILVKPVIMSSTAGKKESAVKNNSVCIGTEKLTPDCPVPTSRGNCPGVCANTAVEVAKNITPIINLKTTKATAL
jgi:hypothetical protein